MRTRTTIARLRNVWSELDYAQRRLLEIRTGIPTKETTRRRQIEALDALFGPREAN